MITFNMPPTMKQLLWRCPIFRLRHHLTLPCPRWQRHWGLGFGGLGVWGFGGLGFGVWGLGFGVWGVGFGVWGLGFGVWGLGFGVWGLG